MPGEETGEKVYVMGPVGRGIGYPLKLRVSEEEE
jgi:uncharacterized membrane protein